MTDPIPAAAAPITPLTPAEKEELRQRVLAGERLPLETSRRITFTLRQDRMSAAAAAAKGKSKRSRGKAMTDAELDADLDGFLGLTKGPTAEGANAGDLAPDLDISSGAG